MKFYNNLVPGPNIQYPMGPLMTLSGTIPVVNNFPGETLNERSRTFLNVQVPNRSKSFQIVPYRSISFNIVLDRSRIFFLNTIFKVFLE
jgi:hypothetical protein